MTTTDAIVKKLRWFRESMATNSLSEALDEASTELERLSAERDHWKGLVSNADLAQFPFEG